MAAVVFIVVLVVVSYFGVRYNEKRGRTNSSDHLGPGGWGS